LLKIRRIIARVGLRIKIKLKAERGQCCTHSKAYCADRGNKLLFQRRRYFNCWVRRSVDWRNLIYSIILFLFIYS